MYIDPAAGSLILQVIAASVLALTVMLSRLRNALRSFFARIFSVRRG
jgi:hypothetical protein